jgi:hypothetical protein
MPLPRSWRHHAARGRVALASAWCGARPRAPSWHGHPGHVLRHGQDAPATFLAAALRRPRASSTRLSVMRRATARPVVAWPSWPCPEARAGCPCHVPRGGFTPPAGELHSPQRGEARDRAPPSWPGHLGHVLRHGQDAPATFLAASRRPPRSRRNHPETPSAPFPGHH